MSEYVLTSEAARILDRSTASVHLYERTGKLPAVRTGRGVRLFKREDVERLAAELSACMRSSPADCDRELATAGITRQA